MIIVRSKKIIFIQILFILTFANCGLQKTTKMKNHSKIILSSVQLLGGLKLIKEGKTEIGNGLISSALKGFCFDNKYVNEDYLGYLKNCSLGFIEGYAYQTILSNTSQFGRNIKKIKSVPTRQVCYAILNSTYSLSSSILHWYVTEASKQYLYSPQTQLNKQYSLRKKELMFCVLSTIIGGYTGAYLGKIYGLSTKKKANLIIFFISFFSSAIIEILMTYLLNANNNENLVFKKIFLSTIMNGFKAGMIGLNTSNKTYPKYLKEALKKKIQNRCNLTKQNHSRNVYQQFNTTQNKAEKMSGVIYEAYKQFAQTNKKKGEPIIISTNLGKKIFYGWHEKDIKNIKEYKDFKKKLLEDMHLPLNSKILEIIGDSNQFPLKQSKFLKKVLEVLYQVHDGIIYGYTGYRGDDVNSIIKTYDINSALNAIIDEKPELASKVIGNVVGHSIEVMEKYKCRGSDHIQNFILVYNDTVSMNKSSRFGSDINISDYFPNRLFIADGGIQSFAQALNCLERNIPILAVHGLRSQKGSGFFSAAEFLELVKQRLTKNKNLNSKDINSLLKEYKGDFSYLWGKDRPDSNTKNALFISSWKKFLELKLYLKLPKLFVSYRWRELSI